MGLLDSSKQRQGQPALWDYSWSCHGYPHLRLGPNHLQRLPSCRPLVGCGQCWHHRRIFLLVPRSHSLCETTLFCSFRVSCFSKYRFCSTPTFGTALTFPWYPHTLLIIRGNNTMSQTSSTLTLHLTSRLTRPTVPSSFPYRSPWPTGSRSHPSPQHSPTPTFTTANRFGSRLVAHFPNNLIFTPVSCPCTKRFRIGGT